MFADVMYQPEGSLVESKSTTAVPNIGANIYHSMNLIIFIVLLDLSL